MMFAIQPETRYDAMLAVAQEFQRNDVGYSFNDDELSAIRPFFTNVDKPTFFVFSLPSTVGTALLAMFSRMKNPRGVRGSWVDSFLPQMLAAITSTVSDGYDNDPKAQNLETKYLKDCHINNLQSFLSHSEEHREIFRDFLEKSAGDPEYFRGLADSRRAKRFLSTWLDKYGHNSIARMGSMWLCCERISLLTAKSIEWARPGTGYIELSTRYVDMGGKDVYPIAQMLQAGFGCDPDQIGSLFNQLFDDYKALFGEKGDGVLPTFYRQQYTNEFAVADRNGDLDMGVGGETSDVLGNLLPLCTLTEVATACSGEALPSILKHLYLDGTPENHALIEAILEEAPKVGADNYTRHWQPSEAETRGWIYQHHRARIWQMVKSHNGIHPLGDISTGQIGVAIANKNEGDDSLRTGPSVTDGYVSALFGEQTGSRAYHDKLPREFELASTTFFGIMSMRGWRDLHRQSLNTHLRTLVGPYIGFYEYDKPQPEELTAAFKVAETVSEQLYYELAKQEVPEFMLQYIMPMGWLVGFVYGGDLRQMEFSLWQRTKPSANHEVRQVFLEMNAKLCREIPWWSRASRASTVEFHREQKYIFARSQSEVGLPLRKPQPVA